jgi:hypothetical protein
LPQWSSPALEGDPLALHEGKDIFHLVADRSSPNLEIGDSSAKMALIAKGRDRPARKLRRFHFVQVRFLEEFACVFAFHDVIPPLNFDGRGKKENPQAVFRPGGDYE